MKKKLLPLALAAAAGLTGINTAHAVHVNADGTGEVLVYPYFTVEGGQDTYINLVNTTNKTKAVKVRFLESMNSQEVLDFNLYLSPQDHWSAVITASANGAQMITADTSCTVPNFVGSDTPDTAAAPVAFRDFLYTADSVNGVARTREGYVEIIEMGQFDEGDTFGAAMAAAVDHGSARKPANCGAVATAFQGGNEFAADINDGFETGVDAAPGGLYGYGVIINTAEGSAAGYDAIALDNFFDYTSGANHAQPGDTNPSLSDVNTFAHIIDGATVYTGVAGAGQSIDAVSAVLMQSSIANDYVLEADVNGATDWVVTFPTKRAYVNGGTRAPFTSTWSTTISKACEAVSFVYYDREEQDQAPGDLSVSPRPPAGAPISLCYEANIISFENSNALSGSTRVELDLDLDAGFENGWMAADFTTSSATTRILTLAELDGTNTPTGDDVVLEGLPVVGFAVQKYVNGAAGGAGVLANYATTVTHKGGKSISVVSP